VMTTRGAMVSSRPTDKNKKSKSNGTGFVGDLTVPGFDPDGCTGSDHLCRTKEL
jgi:hypothetical protein